MVKAADLEVVDLAFRIGEFSFHDLCLRVEGGEYFVLMGPNGSGKTMLIKLIAGLLRPTAGDIIIGGKRVTNLAPWERGIGYVPQIETLFPHMSVRDNIAFGLEVRGVDRRDRSQQAADAAERLGIAHLLERRPVGLSGGEQQKVSLARAENLGNMRMFFGHSEESFFLARGFTTWSAPHSRFTGRIGSCWEGRTCASD